MKLFAYLNRLISEEYKFVGKEDPHITDEKRLSIAIHSNKQDEPENTFLYIYNKYKPLLIFIASRYLKNSYDIDDVVQETFIEFFKDVEKIRTTIKAYLSVCCKHNALDLLKKQKSLSFDDEENLYLYPDNNLSIETLLIFNEEHNKLLIDMKSILSNEDINIILLHLIDNMKFDDIGLKLKQNVKTVKTKYYRALKMYKKKRGVQ